MTDPHRHATRGPLIKPDPMETRNVMDTPRCTATSKQSGQRCKRRPIPGGPVCVIHGGAAPQVKAAAQARLLALQPAIDRLTKLIAQEEFPTVAMPATPISKRPHSIVMRVSQNRLSA
jgi:hypothetical protein